MPGSFVFPRRGGFPIHRFAIWSSTVLFTSVSSPDSYSAMLLVSEYWVKYWSNP